MTEQTMFQSRERAARRRADKLGYRLRKHRGAQPLGPYWLEEQPLAEMQPARRVLYRRGRFLDQIEEQLTRLEAGEQASEVLR